MPDDVDALDLIPAQPAPRVLLPLEKFVGRLRGTEDEVFSHLLAVRHRGEKKTVDEWRTALDGLRRIPITPRR